MALTSMSAGSAFAYSQTITDVEDPDVGVKILGLEVQASRDYQADACYLGPCPAGPWLASSAWNHSLAGNIGEGLTQDQLPKTTIERGPIRIGISGELTTDKAEGTETYQDMEYCQGGQRNDQERPPQRDA